MTKVVYLPLYDKPREKELSSLLEDLSQKVYPDSEIEKFANSFTDLYSINGGFFHAPYGVVSGYITELHDKYGKDYIDVILHNLNHVVITLKDWIDLEKSSPKQKRYIQTYRSVINLHDYVSMEAIRVDQIARQLESATKQANIVLNEARELNNVTSKLSDDINLLAIQLESATTQANTVLSEAQKLNDATNKLSSDIDQVSKVATKNLDDVRNISDDAKSLKTEVVSILAIFAAIILAFTGGLTIFGGVVAAVSQAQLYQLLLVTIFCTWGLFNTIYLLLCMVTQAVRF